MHPLTALTGIAVLSSSVCLSTIGKNYPRKYMYSDVRNPIVSDWKVLFCSKMSVQVYCYFNNIILITFVFISKRLPPTIL